MGGLRAEEEVGELLAVLWEEEVEAVGAASFLHSKEELRELKELKVEQEEEMKGELEEQMKGELVGLEEVEVEGALRLSLVAMMGVGEVVQEPKLEQAQEELPGLQLEPTTVQAVQTTKLYPPFSPPLDHPRQLFWQEAASPSFDR